MKHLATCKERSALIQRNLSLKFKKKLRKSVDMMCLRCYNIQVSRVTYAIKKEVTRWRLKL